MAQVLERAAEAAYRGGDIQPIRDELRAIAAACRPTGYAVTVVYDIATKVMHERARTVRAYEVVGGRFGPREEVAAALNMVEQDPDPWQMDGYPVRWTAAVDQVMAVRKTLYAANRWARSVHVHSIERAALARNNSTPAVVRVLPLVVLAIFATLTLVSLLVDPKLLMYTMFGVPMIAMAAGTHMMGGPDARSRRVYGDIGPVRRTVHRRLARRRPVPERNRLVLLAMERVGELDASSSDRPLAFEQKPVTHYTATVRCLNEEFEAVVSADAQLGFIADQISATLRIRARHEQTSSFLDMHSTGWMLETRDSGLTNQEATLNQLGQPARLNLVHSSVVEAVDRAISEATHHRFCVTDADPDTLPEIAARIPFSSLCGSFEGESANKVRDMFDKVRAGKVLISGADTWLSRSEGKSPHTREILEALVEHCPPVCAVVLTGSIVAMNRALTEHGLADRFAVHPATAAGRAWMQDQVSAEAAALCARGDQPVLRTVQEIASKIAVPSAGPELYEPLSHARFRLPDPSDPLYSQATNTWLDAEKAWNANALLLSNTYGVLRDETPIERPDPNAVRDVFPLTATDLAARIKAVRAGLQVLDEAWLAYLVNAEEAFLTMPRLRDDHWPATKRYREAMAVLGEAIEAIDTRRDEAAVEAGEAALHDAEDAWHDARLAAADAGTASLPEREQRALRRAAHHIQVLEDPNLPKAMRDERLRQLRAELDRLDTVPISYEQVMTMPQLETVRRLALEAAPEANDVMETY